RGEAATAAGRFEDAAGEYEVAVRLAANDASLQLALAEACVAAQRPERAKEALEKVRQLEPNNGRAAELMEKLAK
ncbi:MAG: tetratricopeptide repeat protein, partial [Singulisphaera sp.]